MLKKNGFLVFGLDYKKYARKLKTYCRPFMDQKFFFYHLRKSWQLVVEVRGIVSRRTCIGCVAMDVTTLPWWWLKQQSWWKLRREENQLGEGQKKRGHWLKREEKQRFGGKVFKGSYGVVRVRGEFFRGYQESYGLANSRGARFFDRKTGSSKSKD